MNRHSFALATLVVLTAAELVTAESRWQDKVDPWVFDNGRAGDTEFLVVLTDQADLRAAEALPTKVEKGAFVYHALTAAAARSQGPVLEALAARGVEVQPFWIVNMIWVRGDLATVEAMARRSDVAKVHANPWVRLAEPVQTTGDAADGPETVKWNIALVNADDVWAAGTTGAGAVVAGQDTGYMWHHVALVNQYRGGPAGSHDYNWHDAIHSGGGTCGADSPFPCDDQGHGTLTMGVVVGDDGAGNQIGMAPGAKWIGCRSMDQTRGTPATYAECFQWFIAPTTVAGDNPDPSMAPDVINNSWGCSPSEGCTDPNVLLAVVQAVRAAGIVTVQSAGNDGSGCSSIGAPAAIYEESFSVGATDMTDDIAWFSSRGPVTIDGSDRMKPDVSAPGVAIRSSTLDGWYQGGWSGTSMAGPHVAGLVALLVSHTPNLAGKVGLIEDIIEQTAVPRTTTDGCGGDPPNAVPNNTYGWGRIDAWAAYRFPLDFTLSATPATVDVCAPDPALVQVGVDRYHGFSEPVTLSVTGMPDGATIDFSTNPVTPPGSSRLTIGGTAAVTPGRYPLRVVGTSSPSGIVHETPATLSISDQPAGSVALTTPANGATNRPRRPTFEWAAASQGGTYRLAVATDPSFVDVTIDESGIDGTTFTPGSSLDAGTEYWWRVRSRNACGAGAWSAVQSFTTEGMPGECWPGSAPLIHFADDFESGAPGWIHSGAGDSWALDDTPIDPPPPSGSWVIHARDAATVTDQRLMSPPIVLPPADQAPITLQFWNCQSIEASAGGCYDGGILEVSTDGGTTWDQLTPAPGTDPYDGMVSSGFGNPLAGLRAWCGQPPWDEAVFNLDAYAGRTVQLRFRLGTDSSAGGDGWDIDDVVVQSCVPSEPGLLLRRIRERLRPRT